MRPHRLTLTAFGAFAAEVTIDLDSLAEGGLFLLHGETGAGKTTLLDGIGFALYGRVPGARGSAKRLRSDHAAPGVRTEVQLDATIAGRRLRITRSPEQTRAKLRGTGTTTEPAKVLLEELTGGSWQTVSTRVGEADAEITDLMGMSAEQFFQVVLLPQGEFAQFLRANSDERAKLLERLFGTDRFTDVERWLAEQRRITGRAVDEAEQRVAQTTARIAQVADQPPPDDQPLEWATSIGEQSQVAVAVAETELDAAKKALDDALKAERETQTLATRQRRRGDAERRRDALALAEAEMNTLAGELDAAARALQVDPLLVRVNETANEVTTTLTIEHEALSVAAVHGASSDADVDALRTSAETQQQRVGRLDGLREVATSLDAERSGAAAARTRADELAVQASGLADAAESVVTKSEELRRQRTAAQSALEQLPTLTAESERLTAAVADHTALVAAQQQLDDQRAQHTAARETAVELREHAHALREQRFEAMVGELAAALEDDTPCPVCGSLNHPDPSELRATPVTVEQEKQADADAQRATDAAERVGAQVAATTGRIQELTSRLAAAGVADLTDDELTAADDASRDALHAAQAIADALPALDTALDELAQQHRQLDERRTTALAQCEAANAEAAAADARAATLATSLAAQLGDATTLDEALAIAEACVRALSDAADAVAARQAAERNAALAQEAAADASVRAGFESLDAAIAAVRTREWVTASRQRLQAHQDEQAGVATLLQDPDLAVDVEPAADVIGAAESLVQARAAHETAVAASDRAVHRARQLAALIPQLAAELAELEPIAHRAEQARRLGDLVAGQGQNQLRMTLSSYVLAARLEEVAEVASHRLLRMSQGRYSLVHTADGRGNAKAGLGLLVRDSWTGADRDTSTLSGGETFMASLALALALADVVTTEAGGHRMEALFVDEGFGSLDEDTLDEVMDVLDGLREGGRMVGVVSHVGEMKARIPNQVNVRKGRTGSEVALQVA